MLKNKIQPSKFADLIGFIKPFINWAASHLATGRATERMYKMEGFYRKKGEARKLLAKVRIIWGSDIFGGGEGEGFLLCRLLLSMEDGEGLCDRLPYWCLTRNFHSGLIKVMFLGEVENTVRSIIKSRFGIMGFWHE